MLVVYHQHLTELPLNLKYLNLSDHTSLEQLPDLSILRKLKGLTIQGCINLQSISLLPSHLQRLTVHECTSLQDLTDLSKLKKLVEISFTQCNNLKSKSLKQSSLEAGQHCCPIKPNREVAEWFSYKTSRVTVSFDIPPSFGSNFSGLALWVVYTCKATDEYNTYIRAVITNNTESITEYYPTHLETAEG